MKIILNKKIRFKIEVICPEFISGWVFSKSSQLTNINLEINKKIISSSKINQLREDVNTAYKNNESLLTGFKINLPKKFNGSVNNISLNVFNIDQKKINLKSPQLKKDLDYLKILLESEVLGCKGNIDGFQMDGRIHGWAFKELSGNLPIWLNLKSDEHSLKVICNQHRFLSDFSISGNYGFTIPLTKLPKSFSEKEIYFSFDSKGKFPIPQDEIILLPNLSKVITENLERKFALLDTSTKEKKWRDFLKSKTKIQKDNWIKLLIVNYIIDIDDLSEELFPSLPFKFLNEIKKNHLEDTHLNLKFEELSENLYWKIWNNRNNLIDIHGYDKTKSFIKEILNICTPDFVNTRTVKSIRNIAIFDTGNLEQCTLYRVNQKISQLEIKNIKTTVFKPDQVNIYLKMIKNFDAVIFFRVPAFPLIIKAIVNSNKYGIPTFYDIDDIIFDEKIFPPKFETYSNLISKEQHQQLNFDTCLFEHAMQLCLYGISSTKCLAKHMERRVISGKVFHHKNALSPIHENFITKHKDIINANKNKQIQIFYGTGTLAHKDCFHKIVEPALARIIDKYGDKVKVNLFGIYDNFLFLNEDSNNCVIRKPIWSYEKYLKELSKADINLSILEKSEITDCKSEIKWLEASIFKIPSILSPTITYKEIINEGEDALFAESEDEFYHKLELLILDHNLRKEIGLNAFKKSTNLYSLNNLSNNLYDLLNYDLQKTNNLKKKVLIVNVYYPPQDWGGATHVVRDNVNELCQNYKNDFDIEVLCTEFGGLNDLEYKYDCDMSNNIRVWRVTTPRQEDEDLTTHDKRTLKIYDEIINLINPDLVHLHCIQRITTSLIDTIIERKIPYIITAHDGWWISPNQFIINEEGVQEYYDYKNSANQSIRSKTLKPYLESAAAITTVSEAFKNIHENCGINDVLNIENGIVKKDLPKSERINNKKVMLAHMGGCGFHKGLDLVEKILKKSSFENIEFTYIDYSQKDGLIKEDVWGLTKVYKFGRFEQDQVFNFLSNKNILIVPSRWPESYGLVVREGLLSGCRVITSNQGALFQEIKEGENGFIFNLENAKESLFSILDFINTNYQSFLKPVNKTYIPRTVKQQVTEFTEIYKSILFKKENEVS